MSVARDPDERPTIPDEMRLLSRQLGYQIAGVICDEPGAQHGDLGGISFPAMMPFLPHKGDRITLEDGNVVEVVMNSFKIVRIEGQVSLDPSVHAVRIGKVS